jgi:hypothetical protein
MGGDEQESEKEDDSKATSAAEMREALKKRAMDASVRVATEGMAMLKVIDYAWLGDMATTGSNANTFKVGEGSVMIKGKNISAGTMKYGSTGLYLSKEVVSTLKPINSL